MRARVRTAGDVGTARLRAAAVIGGADLRAPSLPPSAVLCVRRVAVPTAIGSPQRIADRRNFDGALQEALDGLARRARRPALDAVVSCDAVVFDDSAELLACLARDWRAGRAGDRWWWRALFRERIALDIVVEAWTSTPLFIGPALERLARWREAAGFASALDRSHVQRLAGAMLQVHGGPAAAELLVDRAAGPTARIVANRHGAAETVRIANEVAALARRYAADETATPLRRDQRALIGIAAVVRHGAPLLRHPAFLEAFRTAVRTLEPRGGVSPRAGTVTKDDDDPALERRSDLASGLVPMKERSAGSVMSRRDIATNVRAAAADVGRVPGAAALEVDHAPGIAQSAPGDAPSQAGRHALPGLAGVEWPPLLQFVDTPLGGVFYLLNAAIAMRLYGDFTMPQRRGLRLSPWDLLALVAETWRGEPLDDATARLLAQLAGRSPVERPGERAIPADRLGRWIPRLVRRINRWTASALGESADVDVAGRVLCHQARVHLTAAHLDVTFDLGSLPIEIRLAGLDRDPGWIPAGGRIVKLHYS